MKAILDRFYDAYQRQDLPAILDLVDNQINWPDAWEGGRVVGRRAFTDYMRRQFNAVHPLIVATHFEDLPDGKVRVEVHQSIEDREGNILVETEVSHIFTFVDHLIVRVDHETRA